jgi:hypothetical protein
VGTHPLLTLENFAEPHAFAGVSRAITDRRRLPLGHSLPVAASSLISSGQEK